MRRLVLSVACLLLAARVDAAPGPTVTPEEVPAPSACARWTFLAAQVPPSVHFVVVSDPVAFLAAFNELPPASNIDADQIYVNQEGNAARLFFVKGGCLVNIADISWGEIEQMMGIEM